MRLEPWKWPFQAYTYLDSHYGWAGVMFGAILVIMFFICVFIFFDRRR